MKICVHLISKNLRLMKDDFLSSTSKPVYALMMLSGTLLISVGSSFISVANKSKEIAYYG